MLEQAIIDINKAREFIDQQAEVIENYVDQIAHLESQLTQPWEIKADKMISAALWSERLRYPQYRWGYRYRLPDHPTVDCSSFMEELYAFIEVDIPRLANAQAIGGTQIQYADRRKGDIMGFQLDGDANVDHVGMYIGNDQFIHANTPELGINIQSIAEGSTWQLRLRKIARYI